jgi:hypothetical protein
MRSTSFGKLLARTIIFDAAPVGLPVLVVHGPEKTLARFGLFCNFRERLSHNCQ